MLKLLNYTSFVVCLCAPSLLLGQQAGFQGSVTDTSKASIVNALMTITNLETGVA